jgi:RNA polymerase sigma-70 factor, ECF subfamily
MKEDVASGNARRGSARGAVRYDDDELDRNLLKRIALNDHVAFRELNSRYRQRVARFVSRVTSRSDVIDEVTNETLWIVWKSAGSFRGGSKVSSWILGIARHTGNRAFRNSIYCRDTVHMAGHQDEESGEPWSQSDTCEWLGAALSRLPVAQRTVLEMAYFVGHSCEEIAQHVNCPVNTVKTRLFHARRKMRALLLCL